MASCFGEDKVGRIPNGIGVIMGDYIVGQPVPTLIDDFTKERLFLIQLSELEQKDMVPISLDETTMLENLLADEKQIKQNNPEFSVDTIPADDPETFKMLSEGSTDGLPFYIVYGIQHEGIRIAR